MADSTTPPNGNPSGNNNANPPDEPVQTDADKIQEWLASYYLEYTLEDGSEAKLSMHDFLQITTLTGRESFFTEVMIILSLALSTKKHRRSDAAVLSEGSAIKLYQLGRGVETLAVIDTLPGIRSVILDKAKRWIVVPCSDGIKTGIEDAERQSRENEARLEQERLAAEKGETAPTQKSTQSQEMQKHGAHWGILIVDKSRHVAHYVDSSIRLKKIGTGKKTKTKIAHMYHSATVAGKILCGIDAILATQPSFEKGKFDASTLKYTPQDRSHNKCGSDNGPYGPFVFAFIDHIWGRSAVRENLKAAFSKSKRERVKFNSKDEREKFRRLVEQEIRTDKGLPYLLNVDLVRILGALLFDHVKKSLGSYQDAQGRAKSRPLSGSGRANGSGGGGGHGGGGNKGKGNDDDDDDYDSDPDETFGDPPVLKSILREEIKNNPAIDKDGPQQHQYELAHALLQSQEEARLAELAGLEPPPRRLRPKIRFPKNVNALPNDFADEEEVDAKTLKKWQAVNDEYIEKLDLGRKHMDISIRAALQVLTGIDFFHETEKRLSRFWIKDEEVFNSKERANPPSAKSMARKMHRRYGFFDMDRLIKDYATIALDELEALVTDKIRNHASIRPGRTANEFTFRAILFVQDGISFRCETSQRLRTIWVRDTNVFTEGTDFELQEDNMPKLLNGINESKIRMRMLAAYERLPAGNGGPSGGGDDGDGVDDPDGPNGDDTTDQNNGTQPPSSGGANNGPKNPPSGGTKRPLDDSTSGVDESDRKKIKTKTTKQTVVDWDRIRTTPIDFTEKKLKQVDEWIKLKPPCGGVDMTRLGVWLKRATLQKIFGGLEALTVENMVHVIKHDQHYRKLKPADQWTLGDFIIELDRLSSNTPTTDFRGTAKYIPKYWRRKFTKEVELVERDFSTLDFLDMPEDELVLWLDTLPEEVSQHLRGKARDGYDLMDRSTGIRARVWLTRMYRKLFQDMQYESDKNVFDGKENLLSEKSSEILRGWLSRYGVTIKDTYQDNLSGFLDQVLLSNVVLIHPAVVPAGRAEAVATVHVSLPDWSGMSEKWPAYWREGVEALGKK